MLKVNSKVVKIISETPGFFVEGPLITSSNRITPIYAEFRATFSDTERLRDIAYEVIKLIKKEKIKFDIIIGGATAGIQLSTAVALLLNKPNGYVRKNPKEGGLSRSVEGYWQKGMKALLVDDACGNGDSKVRFIDNIRTAGMKIDTVIAVSSRTRTGKLERKWIKDKKVRLFDFCDISDIVKYSVKNKIITEEGGLLLDWYREDGGSWNNDPEKWKFFENYKKMKKRDSLTGI